MSSRVSIETRVFVEYIDTNGAFHSLARALINSLNRIEVFVPGVTLTETCYVTARIYKALGVKDYFRKALSFVEWLRTHPSVQVVRSFNLDVEAAKIKTLYNVALTDCYVLALSKIKNCMAIFRKREKEMSPGIEKHFKILFLEDYA
ncbi:MAG: PIN domain-containing protein [Candidatus Freyarchaeota archaeon]